MNPRVCEFMWRGLESNAEAWRRMGLRFVQASDIALVAILGYAMLLLIVLVRA